MPRSHLRYKSINTVNFYHSLPTRRETSKQVQFNNEVARATFTRTDRCLKSISNANLVDEEEIASPSSEFQNMSRIGICHALERENYLIFIFKLNFTVFL